jgi:hypothetical protein
MRCSAELAAIREGQLEESWVNPTGRRGGGWELELSAHLLKRMEDRAFNEVDVRAMITAYPVEEAEP